MNLQTWLNDPATGDWPGVLAMLQTLSAEDAALLADAIKTQAAAVKKYRQQSHDLGVEFNRNIKFIRCTFDCEGQVIPPISDISTPPYIQVYMDGWHLRSPQAEAKLQLKISALHHIYQLARRVMYHLDKHGANGLPYLMDSDENPGQFLRDAIAKKQAEAEKSA